LAQFAIDGTDLKILPLQGESPVKSVFVELTIEAVSGSGLTNQSPSVPLLETLFEDVESALGGLAGGGQGGKEHEDVFFG